MSESELVIFIIIALIILGCIWGYATNKVIEYKGYDENWFWHGFFFELPALLLAMSRPEEKDDDEPTVSPLSLAAQDTRWECVKCGKSNYSYVNLCSCGNTKGENNIQIKRKQEVEKLLSASDQLSKLKFLLDAELITQ